jgi:glycerophosphoryl diester phosphodiesterase
VRFDLDLKICGREDEIVAALRERGLIERAMVSGMEVQTTIWLRDNAPDLECGWTIPKVGRDWSRSRALRPLFLAGSAAYRAQLPRIVRRDAGRLGVRAIWTFHALVTARLLQAAHERDVLVIAWTVDDPARIAELAALGIDGICSNDPRLFAGLGV